MFTLFVDVIKVLNFGVIQEALLMPMTDLQETITRFLYQKLVPESSTIFYQLQLEAKFLEKETDYALQSKLLQFVRLK